VGLILSALLRGPSKIGNRKPLRKAGLATPLGGGAGAKGAEYKVERELATGPCAP